MPGTVLIVDHDPVAANELATLLRTADHVVEIENDGAHAVEAALRTDAEVIVVDLRTAELEGHVLFARLAIPVVLVTPRASSVAAIAMMRAGVFDAVNRMEPELLVLAIERALRHHRLTQEVGRLRTGGAGVPLLRSATDPLVTAAEIERRYITHVLATVNGNKSRAARILGLDRRTLYRKLDRGTESGEMIVGAA